MFGRLSHSRAGVLGISRRYAHVIHEGHSLQEKVVNLCVRRGFTYHSSSIYGGLANAYDLGPLGAQLKQNLRRKWWEDFVERRVDTFGIETAVMLHPQVWHASGHVENFVDPLIECKECHQRHRADKLVGIETQVSLAEIEEAMHEADIACPGCGAKSFTPPMDFNMLFQTHYGPVNKESGTDRTVFLRPETAQGVYINFRNLAASTRRTLPFGVGQVGKSFRNEISPGNFLFRTREFEQAELQYFCDPDTSCLHYKEWVQFCLEWLNAIGLRSENLRAIEFGAGEAAHYALATTDIEYKFPFGWGELWGIANRGCYDLERHSEASGQSLKFTTTGDGVLPHVIEPAVGLDRLLFAVLADSYSEETVGDKGDVRIVLKLHKDVAPVQYAILPLSKKPALVEMAADIYQKLAKMARVDMDVPQSIGKRYRRQDEIGTPNCVTVDFQSLEDGCVTIRDRDTMRQERVHVDQLISKVQKERFH